MKNWIQAFRLRTLPLAFSSILMGTFLAIRSNSFNWLILSLCLLTTLFLQVLSNLANDYGDSVHGADSKDRKGPSRAVQTGAISKQQMKTAIIICGALSFCSGITLLFISFGLSNLLYIVGFTALGLLCIAAAIKYTAGSNPYGYAGLGDISVLVFFGLVGVLGTNFMFTYTYESLNLLPAFSCGLFATGVLNVNNIRDIESDELAGKKSIPVRLGRNKAVIYHWGLLCIGMICMLTWTFKQRIELQISDFIYLISFPLFIWNGIAVTNKKSASSLDPYLKQLALSTLLFSILCGISMNL